MKNGEKNIETAAYNFARTVCQILLDVEFQFDWKHQPGLEIPQEIFYFEI